MTIERVLPTGQTETEYFNEKRVERGLAPVTARVTKIRPGLRCCAGRCKIGEVVYPVGDRAGYFTEEHSRRCPFNGMAGATSYHAGYQAVARIYDGGEQYNGVLVLNGLFPHEDERNAGVNWKEVVEQIEGTK